jgi:hypothetical protein
MSTPRPIEQTPHVEGTHRSTMADPSWCEKHVRGIPGFAARPLPVAAQPIGFPPYAPALVAIDAGRNRESPAAGQSDRARVTVFN